MLPGLMGAVAASGLQITRTTEGLFFREQFTAADQQLDGYNGWEESDPGSYQIASNVVEARWAVDGARQAYNNLGLGERDVIVQVNAVRNSEEVLVTLRAGATSLDPHDTTGAYGLSVKAGEGYRIFKGGTGELLGSGGSAPGIGVNAGIRLIVKEEGSDHRVRVFVAEGITDLQTLDVDPTFVLSVLDTDAPDLQDWYGLQVGDGSNAGDSDFDEFFVCGREIVVTGLETGEKIQVDERTPVEESGGEVRIDPEGWALPATTVKVLDPDDNEVASLTPGDGVWGGDEYEAS
ncbi:MAG: hypothetical protein ACLFWG_00310 [Longimicrobiales bacterium]